MTEVYAVIKGTPYELVDEDEFESIPEWERAEITTTLGGTEHTAFLRVITEKPWPTRAGIYRVTRTSGEQATAALMTNDGPRMFTEHGGTILRGNIADYHEIAR